MEEAGNVEAAERRVEVGPLTVGGDAEVALWIGGRPTAGAGRRVDTAPATGQRLATVHWAGAADVDRAVEAGVAAAPGWRSLGMPERAARVAELARRLEHHLAGFALCDSLDSGSPIRAMRGSAAKGAAQLAANAGVALEVQGRTIPASATGWHLTKREPYGVVGAIAAYNHPTLFACQKVAPPLVAGNTVVLKPSEQAPLTALALAALATDILPPGVLNVVPGGPDAGQRLAAHPAVTRLSFTGSVTTGLAVQEAAASSGVVKPVTLELGGKNPIIVLPDADPGRAAAAVVRGMNFTRVQGQSCGSTSRLLVHRSLHDRVVDDTLRLISKIRMGLPEHEETEMGSLVSQEHRARVLGYVDGTVAEGAQLLAGGGPPKRDDLAAGAFVAPTVLDSVEPTMRVAREEVFGPVLSVMDWDDLDEAVAVANGVPYGLTASVWTNDLAAALTITDRLEVGYVWINDVETRYTGVPFGGWKQSGIGSEQALAHEIESYTRLKAINIAVVG